MNTATDLTREHYQRPEVKEIILNHALHRDDAWRALNGDFHRWYRYSDDGKARLLNAKEDYGHVTSQFRTLYQTLNVFDPSLWMISKLKDEITSENPLGTPADTIAYTLGVDIDNGHGYDIDDPETRQAVEAAAQFLVGYLKDHGVHKSVWVLFSGGGIYVELHHEICKPMSSTPEDRTDFFEELTDRYNRLINHVSEEFFKVHPEHKGKVKYDALNNSKRVFKCILSIHKKKPYAVTPLNRDAIKIDFERARIPLKEDMIAEVRQWYSTYDAAEREPLLRLLDEFKEPEEEARQKSKRQFKEIWTSVFKVDAKYFPPCIRRIIDVEHPGEGRTRFSAILSTFLYQMGWPEDEAWSFVEKVSDRNGLPNADHIFDSCFGRISCPSCQKIQTDAAGYPHLGLKGLGVCKPDETCKGCQWPGDYPVFKGMEELSSQRELTLEQLTKATGKMVQINPDTGDPVLDDKDNQVIIAKRVLSPSRAAKVISLLMSLRTSAVDTKDNQKLWRCNGKIWAPDGERQVKNLIDAAIGDLSYEKGLHETLRRIRGISDTVTFDSNPYLFPALDEVIDLKTGIARDYRPEDYITFQYGAAYDNLAADSRPVLWAMCSSLPDPRDVLTVLDIVTAACIRLPLEAIIQLIGPGANGKGLLERIIIALCTVGRVASITLGEAKASRFGPAAVLGKDVWILSEVEDVKYAINLLKKVATGELMDSDVKYNTERTQGKPHVLPILDCNNAIDFGDDSWGRKRRIIKLDFPYTFDYVPGTRLKDPHLEEKVTSPAALSGLLRIIAAHAQILCASRRIYTRKRPEEMDAEYKRQQYSLHFFCEKCLTTSTPIIEDGKPIPKLTTDALYEEYKKYCSLFNVPVLAEKGQIGKYLKEKFNVSSTVTTENKQSVRYYPGLWLSKSANTAYAEFSINYSNYTKTTDKLQEGDSKNDISSLLTTVTTDEWPKEVLKEIERMFGYIQSCNDPQKISYKGYLESTVVSVVAVVSGQEIAIPKKSPVVFPVVAVVSSVVSGAEDEEPTGTGTIKAELLRADEQNAVKEAHFSEQAVKYTKKTDPIYSSCLSCGDPIGPGHSTYFETFCGSCGPKLAMVRAAVKAHPDGFTLAELWEDLAARGDRPPLKEHISGMLQYLGYIEDGSVWRLPKSPAEPDPEQVGAEA